MDILETWFGTSGTEVVAAALSAVGILVAVIVVVRLAGLRTFSKMSSFDFAVTVAIGSLMATASATSASLPTTIVALATLVGVQWVIAQGRRRGSLDRVVDNQPLVLMAGRDLLEDNLTRARVSESDVIAKLREANVTDLDQVLAVVLETTGDISVLHGQGPLDPRLLDGVRGNERVDDRGATG